MAPPDKANKKAKGCGEICPTRESLHQVLQALDASGYPTPTRESVQTASIQNFLSDSISYHQQTGTVPTPQTQLFHLAASQLSEVGSKSIVDRQSTLFEVTKQYLHASSKSLSTPKVLFCTQEMQQKLDNALAPSQPTSVPVVPNHSTFGLVFGGEKPQYGKKRIKESLYDDVPVEEYGSLAQALCNAPGLGPNAKRSHIKPSHKSTNGFRAIHFHCKYESTCKFRSRIFYPVPASTIDDNDNKDDNEQSNDETTNENENAMYLGPVGVQRLSRHSCGQLASWKDHLLKTNRGKQGLNPILKEAVDTMVACSSKNVHTLAFRLPNPDEMVNLLLQKLGDDCTNLFPNSCLEIVTKQIQEYWRHKRNALQQDFTLAAGIELKYLPQIETFRMQYGLKVPHAYLVRPHSELATLSNQGRLRDFATALLTAGGTTPLINPTIADTSVKDCNEHHMVILSTPPIGDNHVGSLIAHVRAHDEGGMSEKHMVCFSTIHLLYQGFIAGYRYHWKVMANIDSTHCADSAEGKLMSFGLVATKKHGRGSDYRRTFLPLIFARIKEENELVAILLLATLKYYIRRLFGQVFDIKGGLISDHAQAFVNAYKRVFPARQYGQCFAHIAMKVKDQTGRRKKGTPGYLKWTWNRNFLTVAARDVNCMTRCPTEEMKKLYTDLCLEGWTASGELGLANVFKGSYVDSADHSHFRYNEFGNPGDTPNTNSLERKHLTMKGSKNTAGLCSFGKSLQRMIVNEFPRMVYLLSSRSGYLQYDLRILDKHALTGDKRLMEEVSRFTDNDYYRMEGVKQPSFLANAVNFVGVTIDANRRAKWGQALGGKWDGDHSKRQELFEMGTALVLLQQGPLRETNGRPVWHCSCHTFFSTTVCCHAYYLNHGPVQRVQM